MSASPASGAPASARSAVEGAAVGEAMARHPGIDMMSFTGSTRAGVLVAKAAADDPRAEQHADPPRRDQRREADRTDAPHHEQHLGGVGHRAPRRRPGAARQHRHRRHVDRRTVEGHAPRQRRDVAEGAVLRRGAGQVGRGDQHRGRHFGQAHPGQAQHGVEPHLGRAQELDTVLARERRELPRADGGNEDAGAGALGRRRRMAPQTARAC